MSSKPGLLRRLLGPKSTKVVSRGARSGPAHGPLPHIEVRPEPLDADEPSAQQFAALVHAVWLVFAADENLDDNEVEHLLQIIEDLTDGEAPHDFIEELFDSYADIYAHSGAVGSAALIAEVLREPELRESAVKLAIGAVCLDGHMSPEEERLLLILASALGYSERQTHALLDEVEAQLGG